MFTIFIYKTALPYKRNGVPNWTLSAQSAYHLVHLLIMNPFVSPSKSWYQVIIDLGSISTNTNVDYCDISVSANN